MALNATVYSFEINLTDLDRNVYQGLAFRVAKHPSETDAYLIARVLAYCFEYREGLTFSNGGLSDPDAPALAVRDLSGAMLRWIEIGLPEPARLHRANDIQINTFDRELIAALSARLARRMTFDLVITEGPIYLSLGKETISGSLVRHRLDP